MRASVLIPYFDALSRYANDPNARREARDPIFGEEQDPLLVSVAAEEGYIPPPPPPDEGIEFPPWIFTSAFPIAAAMAVILRQQGRLAAWHHAAIQRTLGKALGITFHDSSMAPDVADFMMAWRRQNISLISSLPDIVKADLEKRVARLPVGDRAGLSRILAQEYRVAGYRLRLITRDQTTKYVSGMNQIRQTSAGVEAYIWMATHDERVRPDHLALDGRRFLWSRPPSIGHPGQPINCRCVARPDVRPRN